LAASAWSDAASGSVAGSAHGTLLLLFDAQAGYAVQRVLNQAARRLTGGPSPVVCTAAPPIGVAQAAAARNDRWR